MSQRYVFDCTLEYGRCSATNQLLFEDHGNLKRAIGIQYVKDGKLLGIDNVKRDVVIAAGSFALSYIYQILTLACCRYLPDSPAFGAFRYWQPRYSLEIQYRDNC